MASNRGRTGPDYDRVRAIVIARDDACHICRRPVDKTLPGTHPLGPTLDHVTPLDAGGSMLDLANCRLAHRRCNGSKGNKVPDPPQDPGPSRDWLS